MKWFKLWVAYERLSREFPNFKGDYSSFLRFYLKVKFRKSLDFRAYKANGESGAVYSLVEKKDRDVVELRYMLVQKEHRQKGIGTDILRKLMQVYEFQGYRMFEVTVQRDDLPSLCLFYRLNFIEDKVGTNKLMLTDKHHHRDDKVVLYTLLG